MKWKHRQLFCNAEIDRIEKFMCEPKTHSSTSSATTCSNTIPRFGEAEPSKQRPPHEEFIEVMMNILTRLVPISEPRSERVWKSWKQLCRPVPFPNWRNSVSGDPICDFVLSPKGLEEPSSGVVKRLLRWRKVEFRFSLLERLRTKWNPQDSNGQ